MEKQEYEVRKTGKNTFEFIPIPSDIEGCGTGCASIIFGILILIGIISLGNFLYDDGGRWIWEFLSNPIIAIPLLIFFGIPILIIIGSIIL